MLQKSLATRECKYEQSLQVEKKAQATYYWEKLATSEN